MKNIDLNRCGCHNAVRAVLIKTHDTQNTFPRKRDVEQQQQQKLLPVRTKCDDADNLKKNT